MPVLRLGLICLKGVVIYHRTPPTTTTVFDDEDVTMAMAQTLIKMKEEKAKEKGVAFKDVEDSSRPVRSITTLQPLPSIDPKDKGKELAHRLHEEELAEIERIQKEKAAQEEVSMAAIYEEYDTIQASIDADALFAAKLQQEDREQYTIKERAKFLAETIAAQRKFRAAQRAAEIRRSYATQKSPKKLKVMKSIENVTEEEAVEYKKENEELRLSLKIIFGDDSEVNYEPLSRIFPIVNWEYKLLGSVDAKDMYVYKLIRANGSSSYHGDMQAFLRRLDRLDLNDLYRMLFDPDEKDELWMNIKLDMENAEMDLYHDVNYASNVEIDCVKAKGDLMSYKMESQNSFNEYTRNINDLNQTILEMKKELFTHQETISIISQEKEAQKKFYKTHEDKEIEKVIALENKVKVLDDIVRNTKVSVTSIDNSR
ncbi:hypothetical protein Tco_0997296 [Tanacetum coccineum]